MAFANMRNDIMTAMVWVLMVMTSCIYPHNLRKEIIAPTYDDWSEGYGETSAEIIMSQIDDFDEPNINTMKAQKRPSHGGICELHRAFDDQFYFKLIAPNGQTIVASETYTRKHNAMKTIKRYFLLFTFKDCTK